MAARSPAEISVGVQRANCTLERRAFRVRASAAPSLLASSLARLARRRVHGEPPKRLFAAAGLVPPTHKQRLGPAAPASRPSPSSSLTVVRSERASERTSGLALERCGEFARRSKERLCRFEWPDMAATQQHRWPMTFSRRRSRCLAAAAAANTAANGGNFRRGAELHVALAGGQLLVGAETEHTPTLANCARDSTLASSFLPKISLRNGKLRSRLDWPIHTRESD